MDICISNLEENVALKYNNQLVLGKESVSVFIDNNLELFKNWELEKIDNSHMLYGNNNLGCYVKLGFKNNLIQRIIIVDKDLEYQRYKVVVSYDGHRYAGFQIQKDQQTIQGELTKIISSVNGDNTLVQGASRTDTGVHALNYVFHFDSSRNITESRWLELLNYQLPNDIVIKSIKKVHPLFHSRYDVHMKRYIYKLRIKEKDPLSINYEWFINNIDLKKLEKNIKEFVGTHDFSSFCKGNPDDTIRTIFKAQVKIDNDNVFLIFEGDGFLRYMIRIMVYALIQISTGQCQLSVSEILNEKNRNHTKHMAPAAGLYLDEIMY